MAEERTPVGLASGSVETQTGALAVFDRTVPLSINKVTVDNTVSGKTLTTLLGTALNSRLKKLTLVPASGGSIYWALGEAAAATGPWLPSGGIEIATDKLTADTIVFYAAANCDMLVVQEG
jgi:hypothetical protein